MNSIHADPWASEPNSSVFHSTQMFASRPFEAAPHTRAAAKKTISGARFSSGTPESETSLLDTDEYQIERQRVNEIRRVYESEWKRQVLDPAAEISANALTRTLRPAMSALLELGPGAIDLTNLPHNLVNGVHLAVILRATFRRRESAPGWEQAFDVARYALSMQGLDEEKVLSGLLG